MSEQSGRKSSDLIDAHAQLEVLKLQIQILKDALKEKEKEVEKEKKLGSEWKQKAFKQVRQQNANTGEKILQSPEYKELEKRNEELEKENEEVKKKLKEEQETNIKRQKEEKERAEQEIQSVKLGAEEKINQKIREFESSLDTPRRLEEIIEELTKQNNQYQEEQGQSQLKVKELKENVQKLSEENVVLREHAEDMQESLQQEENNRALGKGKEKDGDKKDPFWKKMGLPTDQTCVEYFACCNSQMKGGWLYVTEDYLVFETSLKHIQRSERSIIKIEDIIQLDKRRILSKWIPGKGSSLLIRTNETEYTFRSFIQRNEAVLLILRQSQKLGCNITTTVEDKPVNFFDNDTPKTTSGSDIGALPERGEYIIGSNTPTISKEE